MWLLRQRSRASAPVEVLCGYRSPETNALLRRTSEGVARNSLHMRAMAMDLRVPGRSLRAVQAAALGLRRGGVGYYPRSLSSTSTPARSATGRSVSEPRGAAPARAGPPRASKESAAAG